MNVQVEESSKMNQVVLLIRLYLGIPLSGVYLNVADYLIEKTSSWNVVGGFNTSMAYDGMRLQGQRQPWARIVWSPIIPQKMSFFFWLAVLERVPTMDRLLFLGIDRLCRLCNQHEEDLPYLCFSCSFAADAWKNIKRWMGLRRSMTTIRSSLKWLMKESRGSS
ncbi:hypothetical protein M9H77_32251 [Catharanthus roseus]|uniref:Uncharacterized protein n=1 Tax=Catharanthus roseus TaxID=4058 RepID=A0ACC0A4F1_CATRO|nr:hypothetical protein M9H77_32251 [Catharanthus roseus]